MSVSKIKLYEDFHNTTLLKDFSLMYYGIGLGEECGEVLGKIKKLHRDLNDKLNEDYKLSIKKELGDVLWYLTSISKKLDSSLEEIIDLNIEKLSKRKQKNKIKGSGDNREL